MFLSALDRERFDVLGCCDNNSRLQGTLVPDVEDGNTRDGGTLPVFAPAELCRLDPDLVLIASSPDYERDILKQLLGMGLPAETLVCGSFLRGTSAATRLAALRTMPEPARCAASGISYFACGFHAPSWPEPACNLAWNSQDLYYDLCMAKAALAAPEGASIGTWILGLAHYSLHYDMTLSRTWRRAFHYADLFGFHNLSAQRRADPVYAPQAAITGSFPFDDAFRARLLAAETALQFAALPRLDAEQAARQAKVDHNKDYPQTVAENTALLHEFVELLGLNGTRTVLCVAPAHPAYRQGAAGRLRSEFGSVVQPLAREHDCLLLDWFDHPEFGPRHFRDGSHLNYDGAVRFTRMLVEAVRG